MSYVIGIDTGGTYTDAVLLQSGEYGADSVIRKSKAITTHKKLETGIANSISGLKLQTDEIQMIDKVVLSTTLATNAIVEGNLSNTGLILIGNEPPGEVACLHSRTVRGLVNIKGRIMQDVNEHEVKNAIKELLTKVKAIAVSCPASVRNPLLEQKVRKYANEISEIPVVCGFEIASELGFLERTNTAVINAGLLAVIENFIKAIEKVLADNKITAPVFVVRGDGTVSSLETIRKTPVDTALSGPAASMIGTINLTGIENAIVSDMGGTTTDTGVVRNKRVELSKNGAVVGGWRIMIKSAKLRTFGLGGDSMIQYADEELKVGPNRVLPACRGGKYLTPTDVVHYSGDYVNWNKEASVQLIEQMAAHNGITADMFVKKAQSAIAMIIEKRLLKEAEPGLPICAIGAPAETWYRIVRKVCDFNLIIPEHYEVANAVGAATAGTEEVIEAIIRTGEENIGYLVHAKNQRYSCRDIDTAIRKAVSISCELAENAILKQNLKVTGIVIEGETFYQVEGSVYSQRWNIEYSDVFECYEIPDGSKYIETRIMVRASGNIFDI